jgi:very-short-patch-repair endonuclease
MDPLRRTTIAQKLVIARQMRREPTPAERHAWWLLRNRQLLGLRFRRQHVLHGFIMDFYCAELRCVLELDGDRHGEVDQGVYDAARTAWLERASYRVIRIRNRDLTRTHLEELLRRVLPVGDPLSVLTP